MKHKKKINKFILFAFFIVAFPLLHSKIINAQNETQDDTILPNNNHTYDRSPLINKIIINGSKTLPIDTIRSKIPYHEDEEFSNEKTNSTIKNIHKLGYFKQVEISTEKLPENKINLHINVTEKPLIKEIIFKGNTHLPEKDISKKLDFTKIPAAELQELKKLVRVIKKAYAEKNYHFAEVTVKMVTEKDSNKVIFTIKEGPQSLVKRVRFKGNTVFNEKKLRSLLFTREDWILGPMDKSGTYHPQAVESDKFTLEGFYQSNGYMNARVIDANLKFSNNKKEMTITFVIHEGDKYVIDEVTAPGNDLFTEEQLLSLIPIRKGQLYSRELIRISMDQLRTICGDFGYIYADIEPMIQPDDKTKKVSIGFHIELGSKVRLNRISIFGNEKTRDKIIRRQLLFNEGDTLTSTRMDASKDRVGALSYFDPRDGVNWKLNRLSEDLADLDLIVKEVPTGRGELKLTYGGAPGELSMHSGIAAEFHLSDRNIAGKGLTGNFMARLGQEDRGLNIGVAQPWLFDKPIRVGFDGYFSRSSYDEVRKVVDSVQEERFGGSGHIGFISRKLSDTSFIFQTGINSLALYSSTNGQKTKVTASIVGDVNAKNELQAIFDQRFETGKFTFLQLDCGQDTRNHNVHISRGHQWSITSKLGLPMFGDNFSFFKIQFDGHWYTPIIDEKTLVLHLRGHLGSVNALGDHSIPYRELYHIGGQASVRGWTFGQIGPMWFHPDLLEDEGWQGDSIGAKRGLFFNAELVFPLTQDLSFKGVVFYDGGTGWNTPHASTIDPAHLKNNSFKYRHSIGIGLRMLNPQPIRIDWGFKLDKQTGEKAGEVSFSSYFDF